MSETSGPAATLPRLQRRAFGLCGPQVPGGIDFEAEVAGWPPTARRRLLFKCLRRELLAGLLQQRRRRVDRIDGPVGRVLWHYTWTTLGDSLMDLSARARLPAAVRQDLLIDPALAGLYRHDPHFERVYTGAAEIPAGHYDLVIYDHLGSEGLLQKSWRWPALRYAVMYPAVHGEHFDRLQAANRFVERLFGLPAEPARRPRLSLGRGSHPARPVPDGRVGIAVALGGRDARRRYPHWPAALRSLLDDWPTGWPRPWLRLLGTAEARADLAGLPADWLAANADDLIGRLSLPEAAAVLRDSDFFLGCDGGLMHVALAFERPGLALFTDIRPALRMPPGCVMRGLEVDGPLAALAPRRLGQAMAQAMRGPVRQEPPAAVRSDDETVAAR